MELTEVSYYQSNEKGVTDTVRCFRVGDIFCVETDSYTRMDGIRDEYQRLSNSPIHIQRKKELEKEYEILAEKLNAEFDHQRFYKNLIIH